jgi:phospho-N-acetylmuramoyl-pentapeptide-transferase
MDWRPGSPPSPPRPFAFFAYVLGRTDTTTYLNLFYLPGAGELTIFCTALTGACLGFLWFNSHPAQVFMGDTGSLALGGAFGTVAILLKAEFLLFLIGGVFVAEAISVILQTSVYKWFKRTRGKEYADAHKVFRMAPLHHHFEKLGWHESTVVTRFYILGIFCAMVALATSSCGELRSLAGDRAGGRRARNGAEWDGRGIAASARGHSGLCF